MARTLPCLQAAEPGANITIVDLCSGKQAGRQAGIRMGAQGGRPKAQEGMGHGQGRTTVLQVMAGVWYLSR